MTSFPTFPEYRPASATFSARECAAIRLRVSDSGVEWLDSMIAQSRLLDCCITALDKETIDALQAQIIA